MSDNGNKVADSSLTVSSSDGSCMELRIPDDPKDENKRVSILVVACKLCICFITGIFFGFALEKGRVFEPKSIRHQMVFESFIMLKMFLAATSTGIIVFSFLSAIPATKSYFAEVSREFVSCFEDKGIITSIIGPFFLGIGMTLSGACPGMVLAQVGAWTSNSIFTLIGCLFGALTYGLIGPLVIKISKPKKGFDNHQVHSTFKWPFIAVALPLGLFIGAVVVIIEHFWDMQKDLEDLYPNKTLPFENNIFLDVAWRPSICGIIIGLLQLPIVFTVKDSLGGSSSYVTVVSQWLVTKRLQKKFTYLEKKRKGLGNWWQVGKTRVYLGNRWKLNKTRVYLGNWWKLNKTRVYLGNRWKLNKTRVYLGNRWKLNKKLYLHRILTVGRQGSLSNGQLTVGRQGSHSNGQLTAGRQDSHSHGKLTVGRQSSCLNGKLTIGKQFSHSNGQLTVGRQDSYSHGKLTVGRKDMHSHGKLTVDTQDSDALGNW